MVRGHGDTAYWFLVNRTDESVELPGVD
ncbi:Beta-galactosidase C-terminal domain, partial [Streptomyces sp. NPDC088124]